MIQRIQTVYLLVSILIMGLFFFMTLGEINGEIAYSAYAFKNIETGEIIQKNYLLVGLLELSMLILTITIFLYKNRRRQMLFTQISLILMLGFSVFSLLYLDMFGLEMNGEVITAQLDYNYNVILMAIPWILTYLALRGIRKDEALVRSADRLR